MNNYVKDEILTLPNMTLFRHDRANRSGGGIGLYARSDLIVTELSKSDPTSRDNPEYIIYRIHSSTFTILFAIVYRPPETRLPIDFLDNLAQFIPLYSHVIVTGDFNINMLLKTDNSTLFRRHFTNKSLHLVDSPPTHHTLWRDGSSHHTWLDLFLVKDCDRLLEYRKSDEPFTIGHDFIEIDYSLSISLPPPLLITSRKLNHLDSNVVSSLLSSHLSTTPDLDLLIADTRPLSVNLQCGLPPTPTDFFATAISNAIVNTFDELAPPVTFITSPRKKPWVSADIKHLRSQRRRLYRIACRYPCPQSTAAYRKVRNEVCSRISIAKNNFISTRIEKASSVSDKWRELRKLGLNPRSANSPFKYFSPDTLNSHFASISDSSSPLTSSDINDTSAAPIRAGLSNFNFSQVTLEDVRETLVLCKSSSVGVDGISAEMIRLSSPILLPHLTALINSSFETGIFPSDWKKALIVPLLKTPSPKSPSDTRPIALLSVLSKLIERIVHKQLFKHLEVNELLDPCQSGYRPNHSTQTALLGFLEDVRDAIDDKKLTGLLAFDFSKAFDTVPQSRLLRKLRWIGCSENVIKWFGSYLGGRTQAVKGPDGQSSIWLPVLSGVPQGSILGPLLFSIYILDLPQVLAHTKYTLYADDLQIYTTCQPTSTGLSTLSKDLSIDAASIVRWSGENGLKVNPEKIAAFLLGSSAYLSKPETVSPPPVLVDNTLVHFSTSLKSLGVTISSSLNWEDHINYISARVFASLNSLRFYKHALTRSLKKKLVESLIFPHFDYACAVYHHLTAKQNLTLHRLLNSCVRYVYGNIPWMAHVTPYRLALGWLSVARRREYFIGSLGFKISRFNTPTYLSERFIPVNTLPDIRRSNRVDSGYFLLPPARTETLRNSFSHCAMRIMNSLGERNLNSMSVGVFQSKLWNHLSDLDRLEWVERAQREKLVLLPPQLHNNSNPLPFLHARL